MNKEIKPFNFWCQKVLPSVYDDSLSYNEVLCKLTTKINEMINFFNENATQLFIDYVNKILPQVLYDSEDERIILQMREKLYADGEHVYTSDDETMSIK